MRAWVAVVLALSLAPLASAQIAPVPVCKAPEKGGFQLRKLADLGDIWATKDIEEDKIAAFGEDGVVLWNAVTGQRLSQVYGPGGDVHTVARTPDWQVMVWEADENVIELRKGVGGELIRRIAMRTDPWPQMSADGAVLAGVAAAGEDAPDKVILVDPRTGATVGEVVAGEHRAVNEVRFSADGRRLIAVNFDRVNLAVLDVKTGQPAYRIVAGEDVSFDYEGTRALVGDTRWKLIDPSNGKVLAEGGPEQAKEKASFVREQPFVLVETASDAWLIDARTGRTAVRMGPVAHSGWYSIFGLQFSDDRSRVVSRSPDGHARLWDIRSGRMLADLGDGYSTDEQVNPFAGDRILLDVPWPKKPTGEFKFIAGGDRLVAARDDFHGKPRLSVWDARTGRRIRGLSWDEGGAGPGVDWTSDRGLDKTAWTSDDGRIAIVAMDEVHTLWNLETGDRLARLGTFYVSWGDVTFSDDGDLVLISDGDQAMMWDTKSGKRLWRRQGNLESANFSDDGTYLVVEFAGDYGVVSVEHDDGTRSILGGRHPSAYQVLNPRTGGVLAELDWREPELFKLGSANMALDVSGLWNLDRRQLVLDCRGEDGEGEPFRYTAPRAITDDGFSLIADGDIAQLWRIEPKR